MLCVCVYKFVRMWMYVLSFGESFGGKELVSESVTKIPVAIILNDDAKESKDTANNSINSDGKDEHREKSTDCIFLAPGDSGSLVLDLKSGNIVGAVSSIRLKKDDDSDSFVTEVTPILLFYNILMTEALDVVESDNQMKLDDNGR